MTKRSTMNAIEFASCKHPVNRPHIASLSMAPPRPDTKEASNTLASRV
jgi:hypothetical protein